MAQSASPPPTPARPGLLHGDWTLQRVLDFATRTGLFTAFGPVRHLVHEIDCEIANMEKNGKSSGEAEDAAFGTPPEETARKVWDATSFGDEEPR